MIKKMKMPLAVLVAGLLSAGAGACAGAGKSARSASPASSGATTTGAAARTAGAASATVPWPKAKRFPSLATIRRYLKNPSLDIGALRENGRILANFYGEAASAADSRAVTAVVKRYYALATAGDAVRACSMMTPSFAKTIPVDYGELRASYLHGAKTCQALLARMFKHRHHELTAPIAVNGVLRKGVSAYALLDSTRMPASIIALHREHGVWTIAAPLGGEIPVAK